MNKLEYIPTSNTIVGVYAPNKTHVGYLIQLEDGFFYFSVLESTGVWQSWVLLDIGNKLKELNADWSNKLDEAYRDSEPIDNLDPFNDLEN